MDALSNVDPNDGDERRRHDAEETERSKLSEIFLDFELKHEQKQKQVAGAAAAAAAAAAVARGASVGAAAAAAGVRVGAAAALVAPPAPVPAKAAFDVLTRQHAITQFFPVRLNPQTQSHSFFCTSHEKFVAAWRDGPKGADEGVVKPQNLIDHITRQHCMPLPATFWPATVLVGDPVDGGLRSQAAIAVRTAWTLSDFGKWYEVAFKHGSFTAPWQLEWVARVARAALALPIIVNQGTLAFAGTTASSISSQRTLEQIVAGMGTQEGRSKTTLAVFEAMLCAKEGLAFRLADSPVMELLLSKKRSELPNRLHVRAVIDVMHRVAIEMMEETLRLAVGFSILFDAWTARSMASSFLAVLYSFLDDDLRYHEVLLDVIPLGDRRHTADNLALEISTRVDQHTLDEQILYGGVTDNAKNVVQACRTVLNDSNGELLARIQGGALEEASRRIWLTPNKRVLAADEVALAADAELVRENAAGLDQADHDARPTAQPGDAPALVDDNDDAGEDDNGDNDNPLDAARAHQCALHDANLVTLEGVKAVPAIARLVAKVDRLTAAVSRSTLRQQLLRAALKTLDIKPLRLLPRGKTRWNSIYDSFERFLLVYPGIVVLSAKGQFGSCASPIHLPTEHELTIMRGVVKSLKVLKVFTKVLETTTNAMAYLPLFIIDVIAALAQLNDDVDNMPASLVSFNDSLLAAMERRAAKHISDANQPSLLAAALHPCTAPFLYDALVKLHGHQHAASLMTRVQANLMQWIDDVFSPPVPSGAGARLADGLPPTKRARLARWDLLRQNDDDDKDDDDSNNDTDEAARRALFDKAKAVVEMKLQLQQTLANLDHSSSRLAFTRVSLTSVSLESSDEAFRKYYVNVELSSIRPLVKLIFSLSPGNSSSECAFSGSGRINAPMRSRLHDDMIEALTVLQFFFANQCRDLKSFAARTILALDRMKID